MNQPYEDEFSHHDGDAWVCLRCGSLVAKLDHKMEDYDDAREKHFNWHRRTN